MSSSRARDGATSPSRSSTCTARIMSRTVVLIAASATTPTPPSRTSPPSTPRQSTSWSLGSALPGRVRPARSRARATGSTRVRFGSRRQGHPKSCSWLLLHARQPSRARCLHLCQDLLRDPRAHQQVVIRWQTREARAPSGVGVGGGGVGGVGGGVGGGGGGVGGVGG